MAIGYILGRLAGRSGEGAYSGEITLDVEGDSFRFNRHKFEGYGVYVTLIVDGRTVYSEEYFDAIEASVSVSQFHDVETSERGFTVKYTGSFRVVRTTEIESPW